MWNFCFFLNIPFVFTFRADPLNWHNNSPFINKSLAFPYILSYMIFTIVHCHFANEIKVKFSMKMLYSMFHS